MIGEERVIGVIGGSGLYDISGLSDVEDVTVESPWGSPSGRFRRGRLGGVALVFLARHGFGHHLAPDTINYRANIDAMKRLGVTDIISFSACGSLREAHAPGDFVIVDQYIDRTNGRPSSFFGDGFVAHVSMARPICQALASVLHESALGVGATTHMGGTYVCINGPQFSTYAESQLFRQWGADVIGMTNMPEARLAREAELPYACVAMVTDYDCWHEDEEDVDVANVIAVMNANAERAQKTLIAATERLTGRRTPTDAGIEKCLDNAVITPKRARDPELIQKLDAIAGRFLANEAATASGVETK
ncbi:MAG: S-methyl-5'-thioadenosine phosphorylase [Pseudomonadota bacterium]